MLTVFQLAFLNNLPGSFAYINLLLLILIYIFVIFGPKVAIGWFLGSAWLLDVAQFRFWGLHLLASLIVFGVVYFLLIRVLTNKSLYSILLLVAVAVLLNDLITAPLILNSFNDLRDGSFWLGEFYKIITNLVAGVFLFYIFNLLTRRIQPVFLKQSKR